MATISYKNRFNKDYFEDLTWKHGQVLVGIDEVGRGCLAGPVVAAAVILLPNKKSRLLKDSKLLGPEELQKGYSWLVKNSYYAWGMASTQEVDRLNIYHASLKAMKRALMHLLAKCPLRPSKVIIDAMPLSLAKTAYEDIDIFHFTSGEQKSSSIAAASIIAKVTRDSLMQRISPLFPAYSLAQHKGYGTKIHQDALSQHGFSLLHRHSFLEQKSSNQQQMTLFGQPNSTILPEII